MYSSGGEAEQLASNIEAINSGDLASGMSGILDMFDLTSDYSESIAQVLSQSGLIDDSTFSGIETLFSGISEIMSSLPLSDAQKLMNGEGTTGETSDTSTSTSESEADTVNTSEGIENLVTVAEEISSSVSEAPQQIGDATGQAVAEAISETNQSGETENLGTNTDVSPDGVNLNGTGVSSTFSS